MQVTIIWTFSIFIIISFVCAGKQAHWPCIFFFAILMKGYKPFVEACIDAGEKVEALKYIPKLADPGEKSQVYVSCSYLISAYASNSGTSPAL